MNDPTDQIEAGGGTRSGKRAGPGRPEVGGAVHVRLGSLLPAVDKWAELEGVSRAEAVRQLVGRQIGYELSIGQVTVEPTVEQLVARHQRQEALLQAFPDGEALARATHES